MRSETGRSAIRGTCFMPGRWGNTCFRQESLPHDRRRTASLECLDQYGLYLASAGAPFLDFDAAVMGNETG